MRGVYEHGPDPSPEWIDHCIAERDAVIAAVRALAAEWESYSPSSWSWPASELRAVLDGAA